MENRSRTIWVVSGLVFLLALMQVHHILIVHATTLVENIDAAIGVTTGHPHWRVYQNRVLGPYLLKDFAVLFSGDYVSAYIALLVALLTFAGYQAWRIGEKFGGYPAAWMALAVLHLSFLLMLTDEWLYIWDLIGLNLFLAFVDFVISERPWYWFCALFAIAIFNRDSSLLIALWLILEPACRWLRRRPLPGRTSAAMMAAGIFCGAFGKWLIEFLRNALMVREVGFSIVQKVPPGYGPDHFWTLPSNFQLLIRIFQSDSIATFINLFLAWAVLAISLFFIAVLARELRYLALALTFAASLAGILMFGYLSETRVFIEIIPLIVLGCCLLAQSGKSREAWA